MKTNNRYFKWVYRLIFLVATLMILLGFFNYVIDPMWCFDHANKFNSYQHSIDERQQKTNYLIFNKKKYDALVIGNSRTAQINQNDFAGMKAFNYAVSSMSPYEYRGFIDNFTAISGSPRTILLGLDFKNTVSGSNKSEKQPVYYLSKSNELFYRYKLLPTKDLYLYSLSNLKLKKAIEFKKFGHCEIVYDRSNIASLTPSNDAIYKEDFDILVKEISTTFGHSYKYNADVIRIYKEIAENSNSRIIAFTTPVSKPFFCAMTRERGADYERWLRDMVEIFGEVWHFEYLHSVSRDYKPNFADAHHAYPEVGTMIAKKVTGAYNPATPSDFGMLLNKSNIDEKMIRLKSDIAECQ